MPKEGRNCSRSRASPFPCSSSSCQKHSSSSRSPPESSVPAAKDIKEWEEVRCPVCMEHPHNAVLLLCSSHDKGCRPFMCDTSYRHSNCLDQYRKTSAGSPSGPDNIVCQQTSKLSCPLCRGGITGWMVMEPARKHMNSIKRGCALESCAFVGEYKELRKHARKDHPTVRPSEMDPERELEWRIMEQRRDMLDLFSSMRSTIGGEEEGADFLEEDEEMGEMLRFPPFMLIVVLRMNRPEMSRGRSERIARGSSRGSLWDRVVGRRVGSLWGETNSEPESTTTVLDDGEDGDNEVEAESEESPSASQQNQGRPRRQLRMSDDEDDADINL